MSKIEALRPVGARVLVREIGVPMTQRGSKLVITDKPDDFSQARGVVVAISPSSRWGRSKTGLRVGDIIYYAKVSSAPVELDGERRTVVNEDRVQAVLPRAQAGEIIEHDEEPRGEGDHLEGEACPYCAVAMSGYTE